MADDKKFAGYVCTGCGIGERLDAGQLETTATRDGKMQSCKQHEMLCSAEGVQMIRDDITNEGVTHVMIAACSRRAKVEAFNFTDVAMSRANLREGVIWVRPDTDENQETTQEMADDYIRMACAEVKFMTQPSPSGEQELNKKILVVGGGVTGMTAALEAAAAGYPVHIVEKSGALGGHVAGYYKSIPTRSPYAEPADTGVEQMIADVEANDSITVHLNSMLAKTAGAEVVGIHAHSGSGILDPNNWRSVAGELVQIAEQFPAVTAIDLGGGLGVPEKPGDRPIDLATVDATLAEIKSTYPQYRLWLEPGRYIVARAGVLLTHVTQTKGKGEMRYIGVGTGMNSLIRPALYGAYHEIINLTRADQTPSETVTVVGPICETGDRLGSDRLLPPTESGDVILIANAGAYGYVMSSRYNMREVAREIVI